MASDNRDKYIYAEKGGETIVGITLPQSKRRTL